MDDEQDKPVTLEQARLRLRAKLDRLSDTIKPTGQYRHVTRGGERFISLTDLLNYFAAITTDDTANVETANSAAWAYDALEGFKHD